jgi:hypothetical protein
MLRSFKNLKQLLPNGAPWDWENCVPLRWFAQMTVGIVPGVVFLALLVKTAHEPLPPASGGQAQSNLASIIPIFSASAVSETANFHRLVAEEEISVHEQTQFRRSSHLQKAIPLASAAAVAEAPLTHDFQSARSGWQHLDQKDRRALDELLADVGTSELAVVLHGARHADASSRVLSRYLEDVRRAAVGACDVVISERGIEVLRGASAVGTLDVALTGDFHLHAPSQRQLEALDELLDYLAIKKDKVQLMQHLPDANVIKESSLGIHFPVRQIMAVIHRQNDPSAGE